MKNFIILTTVLAAFTAHANTSDYQCVPTKSVESAKADYDYSLQVLNAELSAEYDAATSHLNQDYDMNLTCYNQQVKTSNQEFNSEIAAIKRDLHPGWRKAVEDATARHNEDLLVLRDEYNAQNQEARRDYHFATEQARLNYDYQAAQVAAEYNRAVCATP
jgi:hypothetical protein